MHIRCPNCNHAVLFDITDRELPAINRTEANLWKAHYFEIIKEITKANKGIRRLKKREAYLLECIIKNNEYFENLLKETKKGS